MNLEQFSTVVDDRRYINPQVGLDESNAFIEKLRESQQAGTQEIAQDTYNLGTAVPSNLGGLGGAGAYFTSRYQTPQTNEVIANLRSTAQAQALSEAMSNKLAQAKERYNKAYKAAQKRAGSASKAPATPTSPVTTGGTELTPTARNPFWSGTRTDDYVVYGLYKLNRNAGESDADWANRSNAWLREMDLKNSWRGNNAAGSSPSSNASASKTKTNNTSQINSMALR